MKTFKDLKVGDYIHIVGYLCGGYMQSLLIDAIENNPMANNLKLHQMKQMIGVMNTL